MTLFPSVQHFFSNRGAPSMRRGKRGGKARDGHTHHRGGSGGGYRGRPRNLPVESNDWRFQQENDTRNFELRRSTIANCTRQLPTSNEIPEANDDLIEDLSNLVRKLPLEDQLSYEFIVPLPSLESEVVYSESPPPVAPEVPETVDNPATSSLDAWLDGLLG